MNEKEAPKSPQQDYYSELIRSLDFYYSRGWRCIPVKAGDKTPLISNWSQKFLTQEEMLNWIEKTNGWINIGVILGEASGWLVDVDLDHPLAIKAARWILPPTGMTFGRASKPRSHWLYICPQSQKVAFSFSSLGMIAEIRSTGHQTVFPPSIHPSGEQIEFYDLDEPEQYSFDMLYQAVAELSSIVLLVAHYPEKGSRHNAALALSGWLLRSGYSFEKTKWFIEVLCLLANDEEKDDRLKTVETTQEKLKRGEPIRGWNSLIEEELYPPAVLYKVAEWMNLSTRTQSIERPPRPLTDLGNAERLAALYKGKMYYTPELGWLVWDEKRFVRDKQGILVKERAEATVREIYREASEAATPEERKQLATWAKASESKPRIDAMIDLARPLLRGETRDFDSDPFLLNCLNGVVDLRTGEMYKHDTRFKLTKLVPVNYNPRAEAPTWMRFLKDIFEKDEIIEFLQRCLGYSITGSVEELKLFVCLGPKHAGKSTLLGTVQKILGEDYARTIPTDAILRGRDKGDPHPTSRAILYGVRLGVLFETEENKFFSSAITKRLIGGDKIDARYMRQDYFEFEPTHKIWLVTNYKPITDDEALISKILLFPFKKSFPEEQQNKRLREQLWQEREGILRWLVEGALLWQKKRLQDPPMEVRMATYAYQCEMNVITRWIEECCIKDPMSATELKILYEAYEKWCSENGELKLSKKSFAQRLDQEGFPSFSRGGKAFRQGIRLRDSTEQTSLSFEKEPESTTKTSSIVGRITMPDGKILIRGDRE